MPGGYYIPGEETLDSAGLARLQRQKLAALLREVLPANAFYQRKLAGIRFDPASDSLTCLPYTTRAELQQDQREHPPFGTVLTYPAARYVRLHQTSGSMGTPLRWLDTAESWEWCKRCWRMVYQGAGLTSDDRLIFPFSFGPFIGFWLAFEAAQDMNCFVLAGGGLSTSARLHLIQDHQITVVCCTPTYALRMAEVAENEGVELRRSPVRLLIVAGEPGGNIPITRRRIEEAWGARVIDHTGMTETSAWGFECAEAPGGVHVIESEFIAEVIDPVSTIPVADGETGELVLTNLGRIGSPLIRYRTGDQVTMTRGPCICGRWFARLVGGVQGRVDDMLIIRGNNVFPSAIEAILREFQEVEEFRMVVTQHAAMSDLRVEVEARRGVAATELPQRIETAIRDRLHFKPTVVLVGAGSLPRFEMKAKRVLRESQPAKGRLEGASEP